MAKKKRYKEIASRTRNFDKNCGEPIDYDRLAKCIAEAIAEENDKRMNAYSITREWMKFIICPAFWIITVLAAILCIRCFIYGYNVVVTHGDGISAVVSWTLGLIFFAVAVYAFFAGKELDREKDRQFVVSVFSGMVSLVALIVAFVALIMGVK